MSVIQLVAAALLSLSSLQQGEKLFLENRPREALPHLDEALYENPQEEKIYLYLGIVYEQYSASNNSGIMPARTFTVSQAYKDLFYYNLGNNHFRRQDFTVAEQMYSNALQINGALEVAYLNRANSRLELEQFPDARQDYIDYLRLDPDTPQRQNIEKIIALLGQAIEEAERERLAELERQKALLSEVLDTLKNASEDTRNLSAGSEEIQEEYEEIDIEN